eukprot:CAMPEP_0206437120 /NCGR_PEP_ID=MMETSP0324_2-20121206/10860_1 /ASSEMBLY_ACC=CAM_ASM_000836 /TAXON_ID=2866 /ORGANISM="Crypthecodinium cohnii, Strain Seligo" /LENGTH=47 /DNA_ID= /DNA_START= /DNA_END= /DNA_ORIENTATION=
MDLNANDVNGDRAEIDGLQHSKLSTLKIQRQVVDVGAFAEVFMNDFR